MKALPAKQMFRLHFSQDFDGPVCVPKPAVRCGALFAGPKKLLHWLEHQLGLAGYPENTDYLRIELYRQALDRHLAECERQPLFAGLPFYEKSYHADRFATASALLSWRDELLLAGWDFTVSEDAPLRLATLAAVETLFRKKLADPDTAIQACGFADRFVQVLEALHIHTVPLEKVLLYEPKELQTPVIQRLIKVFDSRRIEVEEVATGCAAGEETNLGRLQRKLDLTPGGKAATLTAAFDATSGFPPGEGPPDASLLILRSRRDSDAAAGLARILRDNPALRPLLLLPEMDLMMERALVLEGFPAMGVLSASLARPSLQVLKLAPAFLWDPVDVFKIMEFATLPVKPLDGGLALEIARVMAQKPGLFSDTWFAAVYGYLEQAEVPEEAREQYEFWFGRRRYPTSGTAPKRDAVVLYSYLHEWALDRFDETDKKDTSLLVLAEQARRIKELLEALPEQRITFLELERIVRTIYEPSPVQFAQAEIGSFEFVHNPGAVATSVDSLLWWNCLFENQAPKPDIWRIEERQYFDKQGITLGSPRQESRIHLIRQLRPVLQTAGQLILVVPEQADGTDVVPGLLLGDVEATFPNHRDFTYCLDDEHDRARLSRILTLTAAESLPVRQTGRTRPQIRIAQPHLLTASEYETPTNLESLFYYPHRWFFRQKLRLYPASLLSVTGDNTLLGSLAHRFFEKLLKEDLRGLDRRGIQDWVETQAGELLPREGATMLLYGREPERNAFLNRVKNAAWSLVSLLRSNGWDVAYTELDLEGNFVSVPVRGKADLVLRRDDEWAIVDLKWSGAKRRKELIQNGEDLQLVLYAKLLPPPGQWPHTAYFILEEGKMIARNQAAFKEAVVAGKGGDDHTQACEAIFDRMEKTFAWRLGQIEKGTLELRTARTARELDALYEGVLLDLLEMKTEDARWDDYRTLLRSSRPSSSSLIFNWQPSRLFSFTKKAWSSMASSSSDGCESSCLLSTYTWHEAHSAIPPQVPSTGNSYALHNSMILIPISVGASSSWRRPSRSKTVTLMFSFMPD